MSRVIQEAMTNESGTAYGRKYTVVGVESEREAHEKIAKYRGVDLDTFLDWLNGPRDVWDQVEIEWRDFTVNAKHLARLKATFFEYPSVASAIADVEDAARNYRMYERGYETWFLSRVLIIRYAGCVFMHPAVTDYWRVNHADFPGVRVVNFGLYTEHGIQWQGPDAQDKTAKTMREYLGLENTDVEK